MNKKIVSIITALLLILQCFSAFAADTSAADVDAIHIEGFLKSIGIVPEGTDSTGVTTRGQAAQYIAAILNDKYTTPAYRGIFADVSADHPNAIAIETLADLGVVRGDGNFNFYPDSYLTYDQAACIFAYMLGYSAAGTLPAQAHLYVSRHGIWDGVVAEYDYVSTQDLFAMIYNILHCEVLEQVNFGNKEEYKFSEEDLLYKNFEVIKTYGVVVKNDISYLWSSADADDATLVVEQEDGTDITVDITGKNVDTRDILGKYITLYYVYNDATRKNDYVYHIEEDTDKIFSLSLYDLDLNKSSIDNGKIYYYAEDGDVEGINLASDCSLIYNNAAYKSHTIDFATLTNKVGFVELIDYDGNKKYDVIKLTVYDTFVVGSVAKTYLTLLDRYDTSSILSYNADDYDKLYIEDVNGTPVEATTIQEGDVLSVAKSDTYTGEKIVTIVVSKGIVNGKITEYEDLGYERSIVLDATSKFRLADRACSTLSYKIGTNVAVYIDAFDNAVYVTNDYGRNMQYAFVFGVAKDSEAFTRDVKVKMMRFDGTFHVVSLCDNVTIDGRVYKEQYNDAYDRLMLAKTDLGSVGSIEDAFLIRYTLDAAGKMKVIDTPESDLGGDKDSLQKMIGGNYLVDRQGIIGQKVPISPAANVINIATRDMTDVDSYDEPNMLYITPRSMSFGSLKSYKVVAYRSDLQAPYADVVINIADTILTMDEGLFLIDTVKHVYDAENDDKIYKLDGFVNGVAKSYWIPEEGTNKQTTTTGGFVLTDELKNAVRGDVLRVVVDQSNKITAYDYIFDRTGNTDVVNTPLFSSELVDTATNSYGMFTGYVKTRYESVIDVAHLYNYGEVPAPTNDLFSGVNVKNYTTMIPGGLQIMIVDDTENKIFIGNMNDVRDFERFGSEASFIIAKFRTNAMTDVIIYNK